jgi:benzoyl-CoA reductase/2-hydroxyglutaryl-CoA dehydratase subunit BcrC/BadD/HgdB
LAPIVSLRGLEVGRDYYTQLLAELDERIAAGIAAITNERKRLLWDNIAVWFKLRDWAGFFAEKGYNFVAATYTNAWAETVHYMDEERPFESMAKVYGLIILNNNLGHRLRLLTRMVEDYVVDGVVFLSLRSCKPYSIGQYDLSSAIERHRGVKTLVIETDMADFRSFSEAQIQTRFEAFMEEIEER